MFLLANKWRINRLRKLLYSGLEISPSIIWEFVNYFSRLFHHTLTPLPYPHFLTGGLEICKNHYRREDRGKKETKDKLGAITLPQRSGCKISNEILRIFSQDSFFKQRRKRRYSQVWGGLKSARTIIINHVHYS